MCNTPWCYGDCEDCEQQLKEQEESNTECPYRKECNWVTVDIKNDRCTTCGKSFMYS